MVPEPHIGGRGGWVIIYPHLKTMAILKIVKTFILLTVSKSCCFNKDQRTVVTNQQNTLALLLQFVENCILSPESSPSLPPPSLPIIVSYAGRKTETISATKNLLKRDLGFTFTFSFWICFFGFVLFVCFSFLPTVNTVTNSSL